MADATREARLILDVVRRTGERYGATHIVDVLCGADTEKIAASGHNLLNVFASGSARKKEEWRALIRQMVAGGFLDHDVAGFGGLSIGANGHRLLRGEMAFLSRHDTARKVRIAAAPATLSAGEHELLAVLKKLRGSIAAQRHLPAYLVFSDKTLTDMARSAPRNLQEFAMVSGVGASKLRDFGPAFVAAIAAHTTPCSATG
jgi:ATP-dependent DNA helicase RecQ